MWSTFSLSYGKCEAEEGGRTSTASSKLVRGKCWTCKSVLTIKKIHGSALFEGLLPVLG